MQIVEKLKQLVASERKITAEIIEHIQEIDQTKIFVELGYPTLFLFLTSEIGYSSSAAQRRIEAARILSAVPEVKEDIKSGSINLSQVALVAQSLRQKKKENPFMQMMPEDKRDLLASIKDQTYENSQKIISKSLDLEIKAHDRKTVQKDESVRLEVTFTKEQMEAFNKVKSVMSHVNPSASVAEVFEYLAKDYLKRKDLVGNNKVLKDSRAKHGKVGMFDSDLEEISANQENGSFDFGGKNRAPKDLGGNIKSANTRQRNAESVIKTKKTRKAMSVSVKRIVWTRDRGQCQHFNPTTGKRCGSNHLLEIDHIKRHRHGGDNHPNNLRLLCKAHNLWRG